MDHTCSLEKSTEDKTHVPVISLVASMMKMTEIKSEKISSVKRVKNSTMLDKENTLMQREGKRRGTRAPKQVRQNRHRRTRW